MAIINIDPNLLEREAATPVAGTQGANVELIMATFAYSQAISLKRIADALKSENINELIRLASLQPVNHYGEGLSEAIQNSIVRGKNGITY